MSDPDRYLYAYTPEDILLQKLRWFRKGHEVSDRQWRDGAERLGLSDLLDRADIAVGKG